MWVCDMFDIAWLEKKITDNPIALPTFSNNVLGPSEFGMKNWIFL